MEKFGVFIGRFQPLQKGHISVIKQILSRGYTPLIVVGSAQESGTKKNPYSFALRSQKILSEFPNSVTVVPLEDSLEDDASWVKRLEALVKSVVGDKEYVYFTHNKVSEKGKYESLRNGEFITDKINHEKIDLSDFMDVNISATDIRNDLEGNKHYLTEGTYKIINASNIHNNYLKETYCS
jgi:nicotinamide mononucleotide adenylyltransferase